MASASEENFSGEIAFENFNIHNAAGVDLSELHSADGRSIPRKLCLVCNDFASGLHYGIPSCEACKAFFKRTVQGNVEYSCSASEDCEITKRRRKACQACRYKKCLMVGMLKEGVRIDRVRGGRQKYKRVEPGTSPYGNSMSKISIESKIMSGLLESIEPEKLFAFPDDSINDMELKFNTSLSDLTDRELLATVNWAKSVSGFLELSTIDQMYLLQNVWLDIFLLNVAYRSMPYTGTIIFSDDFTLKDSECRMCGVSTEFNSLLRKLCSKLTGLKVSKEEYMYMKTILLFNPETEYLQHKDQVQKRREKMQDYLQEVCIIQGSQGTARLCSLIFILASLHNVRAAARNYWLAVKNEGKVGLHKLLCEMLELMDEDSWYFV
ncbi:hypothetical protein HELRODRAFT_106750 [Helobdella robusta]|uniref:Uncharacterized protein n=1 Tax=Helobdella robusta TaxID=6412 RepID=T1EE46_HELRO|nr:hypothetical protein HELRODRAFT_106750 [Helobdella robusta]ESO02592.1 hypothetical protein HELRODRAFT_106750 [Helobdella robusta]